MDQILLVQKNSREVAKMLDLLKKYKKSHTEIIFSNNPEEAILRIKKNNFQAIFIDFEFNEIMPFQSIMESGKSSPVIILVNKADEEKAQELLGQGVQDILVKWEFDRESLFKVIKHAVLRGKSIERLRLSEEKLKKLFDFAPLGFFLIDMNGKIIDENKAAEKIFGYYRRELTGKRYFDLNLLSPDQRDRAIYLLMCNSIGMPTGPDYFYFKRKTGEKIKVEFYTNSVQINNETYAFGIVRELLGEGMTN